MRIRGALARFVWTGAAAPRFLHARSGDGFGARLLLVGAGHSARRPGGLHVTYWRPAHTPIHYLWFPPITHRPISRLNKVSVKKYERRHRRETAQQRMITDSSSRLHYPGDDAPTFS